jgi:hypothetical protein
MSVVPRDNVTKIQFFEDHIAPWTASAVAIGTTAAAVTALQTKTEAARDAYTAQQAARQAAETATEAVKQAVEAMGVAGAAIIDQIRAAAKNTGNNVYVLAEIPAPATPAPVGPPGTPSNFKVKLKQDGTLELGWKCNNPVGCTGVVYQVWRRFGGSGEFAYVGGNGGKEFVDATIPAGETQVTYKIQAVRSTSVGDWAEFNVNFGTNSGGTMTASVEPAAPKIAA